jgi:hypothetical protein
LVQETDILRGQDATRARRGPARALVFITALLLAGYFGIVVWAWSSPTNDPQAGMAVGFLMLVTLFLLGLAGLLWYSVAKKRRGLAWVVFAICASPSLSLLGRGIYLVVRWFNREPYAH